MVERRDLGRRYSASENEVRDEYFEWLTFLVDLNRDSMLLAKALHEIEFYSIIANDDNRAEDGKMLRNIFKDETLFDDYSSLDGPCSVLEMLVGLSIRMESILEDPEEEDRTPAWFWLMLTNLGLNHLTDDNYKRLNGDLKVRKVIEDLLGRDYSRSGKGGLFPLKDAKKDQRKVEIWYQLSSYLIENYIDESEING